MKIIIGSDTYYPHINGASYLTQRLAKYLKESGHDVLVIAPSPDVNRGFFEHDGVRAYGLLSLPIFIYKGFSPRATFPVAKYKNFRLSPSMIEKRKLETIVQTFNPNVIHIMNHFFIGRSLFGIAAKHDIPIVGTSTFMPENFMHYSHLPDKLQQFAARWVWKDFRRIYERLDAVSTLTHRAASLMDQIGFDKEVFVISSGIDFSIFNPDNHGQYLQERYQIPDTPTLLYLGRLDKEKHIDTLLKAFSRVESSIPIHFVIAGTGQEKEQLQLLTHRLKISDRVTFTDFVPDEDVANLYALANTFIIASTAELQSIVTLQALASGLPVIGADSVALPELVHDQENGYLFDPNNPDQIAQQITNLFSNPKLQRKMSDKSLEIIQPHNINHVIGQYNEMYRYATEHHTPIEKTSRFEQVTQTVSSLNPL